MSYEFKVGDKCKTRDGDDAEVIHIMENPVSASVAMVAMVTYKSSGLSEVVTYHADGSYITGSHGLDLIPPKPEPTYRPYETKEEIEAMRGKWVQHKELPIQYQITGVDSYDVAGRFFVEEGWVSSHVLVRDYTHLDGTPCGVEVTE